MYQNKLVATLKSKGQILREDNGCFKLPFGSEYTIYLKNMESRKAVVSIDIDGEDVLDNKKLIIEANETLDFEGFMKGTVAENKFKFIQRTKNIEEHRGIHADDGLVRIEFTFEKLEPITQEIVYTYPYRYWWNSPQPIIWYNNNETYTWEGNSGNYNPKYDPKSTAYDPSTESISCSNNVSSYNVNTVQDSSTFDEGITTKGAPINQNFNRGYTRELEDQSHTIILRLIGYNEKGLEVKSPIFTRERLNCEICGYKNTSSNKYCAECGTYLSQ